MKNIKLDFSIVIFAVISFSTFFVLIYNILYFNPILGYDAEAHFRYVDYLSRYLPREIKLPTEIETREFFNPPLAYFFPSIVQVFCRNLLDSNDFLSDCRPIYGNMTQIFQSIMYIATVLINLYTLKLFNKSKSIFNVSYLILVSLLAVNYRTISMIRGEPYILFFLSLFLLIIYKVESNDYLFSFKFVFLSGLIIAGIALSRQWGFLLFVPLIILLFYKTHKKQYLIFWSLSAVIGALLSGWFYIGLYIRYGSFAAFNMESKGVSLMNQDLTFYIPSSAQLTYLFSKPIRPNLDNQFISILYSDLWGDYWGYFSFTSRFLDIGREQTLIGDYLARVNIVSIITSFIIIIFCYFSYKKYKSTLLVKYVNLAFLTSIFGYLLFAIAYPNSTGDTIKSTYIIQAFHLLVFLASIYFNDLKKINLKIFNTILLIFVIIYFHNFQSYLSHFPFNYLP